MRIFILLSFISLLSLPLAASQATLKVPYDVCSKYPYAHTVGGTIHSRMVHKKKIIKEAKALTDFNEQSVLTKLKEKYPNLGIEHVEIEIQNCGVYYQSKVTGNTYLFDAGTFTLEQ